MSWLEGPSWARRSATGLLARALAAGEGAWEGEWCRESAARKQLADRRLPAGAWPNCRTVPAGRSCPWQAQRPSLQDWAFGSRRWRRLSAERRAAESLPLQIGAIAGRGIPRRFLRSSQRANLLEGFFPGQQGGRCGSQSAASVRGGCGALTRHVLRERNGLARLWESGQWRRTIASLRSGSRSLLQIRRLSIAYAAQFAGPIPRHALRGGAGRRCCRATAR